MTLDALRTPLRAASQGYRADTLRRAPPYLGYHLRTGEHGLDTRGEPAPWLDAIRALTDWGVRHG